jgi:endonuclease I
MNLLRKSATERNGREFLTGQKRNKTCHKIPHKQLCGYEEEKGNSEKGDVDKESRNNQEDKKA